MTDLHAQMTRWRHDLHRHPEFGFEETRTAAFVAETLRGFGLEVAEGIGGTGVVGTLKRGTSNRAIALRADMDALRITETTGADYASQTPGTMQADQGLALARFTVADAKATRLDISFSKQILWDTDCGCGFVWLSHCRSPLVSSLTALRC